MLLLCHHIKNRVVSFISIVQQCTHVFYVFYLFTDVMPANFEGAKLMVNKGLSNHFQVSHTINLSSTTPSGYRFGTTYVGTKQISPTETFPVILGDIDPSGNLNANIIHQVTPAIRCKFASQVSERFAPELETIIELMNVLSRYKAVKLLRDN